MNRIINAKKCGSETISNFIKTKIIYTLALPVLLSTLVLTGCGQNGNSQNNSKVTVAGSTSVQELAEELGAAFENKTKTVVDVQGIGSTAGIKAVNDGTSDIGTSSRELKAEEKAWNLTETTIALDGIAVIVSKNNKVEDLTKDQIIKIFKGEIKNWSEVGGENKEIIIVSREAGSGTRDAFEELLMLSKKEDDKTISLVSASALIAEGNGSVLSNVASKDNSIGYMSLGVVDDSKVKKVKVDGTEATKENIQSDNYAISRPFLMLTKGEPKKEAKAFLDFILSDEGQKIVSGKFIPVK